MKLNLLMLEGPLISPELQLNLEENFECKILDPTYSFDSFANSHVIFTRLKWKLSNELLSNFPSLRAVVTPTTGLDHIDIEYCAAQKIEIFSLKNQTRVTKRITSTAELTLWFIIELNRNFQKAVRSVQQGLWNRNDNFSNSLANKKLGILGYGRIGQQIDSIARSIGMTVLVYEINPTIRPSKESIRVNSIEELFKECDMVTIHVNDKQENTGLISQDILSACKSSGVILINTSRGFILNEQAVVDALVSGKLSGLGVDVLVDEDQQNFEWIKKNKIWKISQTGDYNVLVTPHVGGATRDSLALAEAAVIEQLLSNLKNRNGAKSE